MIKIKGIAFKIAFYTIASTSLIFIITFGYNYFVTRNIIEKNIISCAEKLCFATANKIEATLRPIERVPENLAYLLESATHDKDRLLNMLGTAVKNNPEIYGSTAAFEPYAFDKTVRDFAPYFYKSGKGVKFNFLKGDYKYTSWDWYQIPKELGRPVWSDPFYDTGGGNIIMATYSVPLRADFNGQNKFIGVVTADISLSWLEDLISKIKIGKTGYGFLISKSGRIVTHPSKELIMNETIFDLAESRNDKLLRTIGRDMINGRSGYAVTKSAATDKRSWLVYAPLPSSGWSLGIIFPQDELMADITRLNIIVIIIGIAGMVFIRIVAVMIARSITRPIIKLHDTTKDIAKGNLDFTLPPINSQDEVGELADSFIYMRDALKKYIKELTETTASKERMESELRIAHDIQLGLVPKIFPPYPDRPEFDIFAVLEPAKEVGGDFYDFFFVDDRRFCFVIGDVVGKGVPAALLMAVTKTLIKSCAMESKSPDITLSKVNKEIAQDNTSPMFVTVFCGMLDIFTGELIYTSAGHNPPYLVTRDCDVQALSEAGSMAAGLDPDTVFTSAKVQLEKNDIIAMYTDGVTEAFNEAREQFTEERLTASLKRTCGGTPKNIVKGVLTDIRSFTGHFPQSDDITLLIFKYLKK